MFFLEELATRIKFDPVIRVLTVSLWMGLSFKLHGSLTRLEGPFLTLFFFLVAASSVPALGTYGSIKAVFFTLSQRPYHLGIPYPQFFPNASGPVSEVDTFLIHSQKWVE